MTLYCIIFRMIGRGRGRAIAKPIRMLKEQKPMIVHHYNTNRKISLLALLFAAINHWILKGQWL